MPLLLIQIACDSEKWDHDLAYLSREDFISKIEGEWYVSSFSRCHSTDFEDYVRIDYKDDNVYYDISLPDTTFMVEGDDPALCSLPWIEGIQLWTITRTDGKLYAETIDLCGTSMQYELVFNNQEYYSYNSGFGFDVRSSTILADVTLNCPSSSRDLESFRFEDLENPYLTFAITDGLFILQYTLKILQAQ